ncbi:M48 family metallopeptidase [Algoriphagus sp. CAU 1675]|uniref:M48 family metallopeptidase n=1 Tax=Algoriphagus sp. CAU 1675 TaxID=3032597 RepID=UPI0023DB2080|nr:M48 family metallopeptidase [Algoriphagus sp. CAU 1675]MDF2157845.1 M48 family metallopeptidase [Algoriphagus sp. CAU 1675]
MKKTLLLLTVGLLAYACAKVPLTGRMQLAVVSNEEIMPLVNEQYEKTKTEYKVLTDSEKGQMVVSVGKNMAEAVEEYLISEGYQSLVDDFDWEFNLLESNQVNAWCMPGGKVAFYTGILPICEDEAGIAVVMGHEIAHAVASHSRERMSNGLMLNFGISAMSTAMGQNPTLTEQILLQSVGMGSELGMLSFSRKHELEADEMGLIFMAMAGYDPRMAPVFWERMSAKSSGQAPPEFLSTHPGPDRRIERLNAKMPEALEYYKKQ